MRSEKATFPGSQGFELAARLDLPDAEPRAYALFAHCFTCSKDIWAASRVARGLTERGLGCLRFDFTGLGHSEGEFANTNFSSNVADLLKAVEWMRETAQAPKILIGHSLGGAAVLSVARHVPEAVAVATIGAPADPEHVKHNFTEALPEIEAKGEAEVKLVGRPFRIKKQFLDDIAAQKLADDIGAMRKALLILHSPLDQQVSIENAAKIFAAAKHPKSFVSLDQADHLLTDKDDARYVARTLSAWADKYIAVEEAETPAVPTVVAAKDEIAVAETGTLKFQQSISVGGRHTLLADEPIGIGDDTGPSPYDFLLAGLGACTSMTLRMYAQRKDLPLDRVVVHLKHEKVHAEDCAECETKQGRIDHIERRLELHGALDESARAKLLEIADKCPVHRTLENEVVVRTTLSD